MANTHNSSIEQKWQSNRHAALSSQTDITVQNNLKDKNIKWPGHISTLRNIRWSFAIHGLVETEIYLANKMTKDSTNITAVTSCESRCNGQNNLHINKQMTRTHVGTDCDEDVCYMTRQDFRVTLSETTRQSLNAVAVAEIANIAQQVHGNFRILHTSVPSRIVFTHTCVRKL